MGSDIKELSERVRTHSVSPVEIVSACLKRIEDLNPTLNAFITVLADQALREAHVAEAQIQAGKLLWATGYQHPVRL